MTIPKPTKGFRWLLDQTATYDLITAGLAAIIGFSSAINYELQGRRRIALLVGAATIGVLAVTAVKHVKGLAAARRKESIHELEGCLYTLHATLDPTAMEVPGRLRLAIHVPSGEDELMQVTEYVGDRPKPGRIGRRFPANAGIIGKAYRENDVFIGRRVNDDYELYVKELVKDWNYTDERARKLNPAVREWMAIPFFDRSRNKVEAVLYIDANVETFLNSARQELILAAVNGIAVFVGKRYA